MNYQKFNEKLLETLRLKYPPRSNSMKELASILKMDQKNLARRMRGETPFTVQEVIQICAFLNISFDSLMVNLDDTVHPLKIYLRGFTQPFMPGSFKKLLLRMEYTAQDREGGHVFLCSNLIPNGILAAYPNLLKFVYFAWSYHRYPGKVKTIHDLRVPGEIAEAILNYGKQIRNIKKSTYLLSTEFIKNICEYILFYHTLDLLTPEFGLSIIEELTCLLDEVEQAATLGVWPGSENQIDIYITPQNLPHGILITESRFFNSAIVYLFFINPIITLHPETFTEFKSLAYSLLRHAENISVSDGRKRVAFIKKQREALSKFSDKFNVR